MCSSDLGPTRGIRMHSGAGRVVRMVLRPMILSERHRISPTVSLKDLLRGDAVIEGQTSLSLSDYVDEILCSGFPAFQGLPERAVRIQLESYLARAVDHDLPEGGFLVRRPAALRAWLTAYAAATSTTTSYSRILDAATPGEDEKPSRNTVTSYREALERLFLLDPVPAWVPSLSTGYGTGYNPPSKSTNVDQVTITAATGEVSITYRTRVAATAENLLVLTPSAKIGRASCRERV